eukprot:GHVQ01041637.1.p3 GENE.GHVQ01041637.1~~GHVQ01041637.1.p3  ORF type:complete len:146 (-),score=21.90 GHVQ01041637.1:999-1436(-)
MYVPKLHSTAVVTKPQAKYNRDRNSDCEGPHIPFARGVSPVSSCVLVQLFDLPQPQRLVASWTSVLQANRPEHLRCMETAFRRSLSSNIKNKRSNSQDTSATTTAVSFQLIQADDRNTNSYQPENTTKYTSMEHNTGDRSDPAAT